MLVRTVGWHAADVLLTACALAFAAPLSAGPLFDAAFRSFDAGSGARFIVIADVTRDGRADCIVANSNAPNVSVLPGQGDGSLGARTSFAAGPDGTAAVQIADVNGDGYPDAVYTDGVSADVYSSVGVMLGRSTGGFLRAVNKYPVGRGAAWLALADMNGDGILDALRRARIRSTHTPSRSSRAMGSAISARPRSSTLVRACR
jgi:hypothetical protein